MIKKLFFLIVMATTIISCQFTETMVLNEDGSGRMSIELNVDDFLAMGGRPARWKTRRRLHRRGAKILRRSLGHDAPSPAGV